jgi:hypothetical protein
VSGGTGGRGTGGVSGTGGRITGTGGVPDACAGQTCSSHGTCTSGVCHCTTGYTGTTCNQCASGYSGYPLCQPTSTCNCTTGQYQCVDNNTLNICNDGCHFTATPCTSACVQEGFVAKSTGCSYDPSSVHDVCWCPTDTSNDILLWSFVDVCNDSVAPSLGFYDTTLGLSFPTSFLQTYNQTYQTALDCTTGDTICFGAWTGSTYWGCGQSCAQTCTSCCATCGAALSVTTQSLGC